MELNQAFNALSMSLIYDDEVPNQKVYKFKILVLGAQNVGKTSIVLQYTHKISPYKHSPTIGTDFAKITVNYQEPQKPGARNTYIPKTNIQCHLQIWDTAGQDRYYAIPRNFYRGAVAIILVYDIGNKKSFQKLSHYWTEIVDKGIINKEVVMIGNKSDTQTEKREVLTSDALKFANDRRIKFKEINAHSYQQVDQVFQLIIKSIVMKIQNNLITQDEVAFWKGKKSLKLRSLSQIENRYNKCC